MSNFLNEQVVMQFYIDQLDQDQILFLVGKEKRKAEIRSLISELMSADTMNSKIQTASTLWKRLFEASMSFISPDKGGYDKLFNFFDTYVDFEELIFASDSFYRDHTLHCIWVYFLGEYIYRNKSFKVLFSDYYQSNVIFQALHQLMPEDETFTKVSNSLDKLDKLYDSVRCISALTHDLGYPLKKIEKINKSIKKVLPYFAINNYEDFSFGYNNIQQEFISNFIDALSRDLNCVLHNKRKDITKDEINKLNSILQSILIVNKYGSAEGVNQEALASVSPEDKKFMMENAYVKISYNVDNSTRNGFLNDYENYQHGIMSAFLLMKNVSAFQYISYNKSSDEINLDPIIKNPAYISLTLSSILKNISLHTCDGLKIPYITDSNYLTFVDELEEFSRISRASQNREYVKEFCRSSIEMDEDDWLNITFVFDNENLDNLNPEISFKGRCKRFLSLFDIPSMSESFKIRVTVKGELPSDHNTYVLEIARKHADIIINGESIDIPSYLKSTQFYTKEEYAQL